MKKIITEILILTCLLFSLSGYPRDIVEFENYQFSIKQSEQPTGPGNNYFSPNNISLTDQGIKLSTNYNSSVERWESSEVYINQPLGLGEYQFTIRSDFSNLDPTTVVGVFFFDYDDAHEIDLIEISKWKSDSCKGQSALHDNQGLVSLCRFDLGEVQLGS